ITACQPIYRECKPKSPKICNCVSICAHNISLHCLELTISPIFSLIAFNPDLLAVKFLVNSLR
ncbi:MAG: hypothetical protein ACC656_14790, partial [Candidatus Heimdallarchaeota archaeon]